MVKDLLLTLLMSSDTLEAQRRWPAALYAPSCGKNDSRQKKRIAAELSGVANNLYVDVFATTSIHSRRGENEVHTS